MLNFTWNIDVIFQGKKQGIKEKYSKEGINIERNHDSYLNIINFNYVNKITV